MPVRSRLAMIVQVVGAVVVSVGVGLVFLPAGVITAGVLAVLFGVAMERTGDE